jgi:hypothetical protein
MRYTLPGSDPDETKPSIALCEIKWRREGIDHQAHNFVSMAAIEML